ncbi:hypothetical protein [Brevundimonas sp. FT23042]|uniref:hypothetical protein n=1 Tax=Brevundimonas sp. FT23042 TaxID=3393749 RepID=UPI003B588903
MTEERVDFPVAMEQRLGSIAEGWSRPDASARVAYQIAAFQGGAVTPPCLATVGLLAGDWGGDEAAGPVHLELIAPDTEDRNILAAFLFDVGDQVSRTGQAPSRGEVCRFTSPYDDWVGLYMTVPLFLEDADRAFLIPGSGEVVLIWALPIRSSEAAFIEMNGWQLWEEILEANFASLGSLRRAELVI